MSGIVGIYYLDGRPVEKTDIQGMMDSIAHRGPDGSGVWINASIALGCQLLRVTPESAKETQPFVHDSGIVIVFDGRLDNREELLPQIKACNEVSAESPDPAFVLAAYKTFGEDFAKYLVGDFALGLYDFGQQKILLARDVIGVRPLYFYSNPKQFLFASEIKALLAHPQVSTRPNDNYLGEFLLEGLSGNDGDGSTFFEGIHTLPPGFMAVVTSGELLKRQYWDFDATRCIRFKSFEDYVEGFRHYFEHAVRRRLRSVHPVAVSVSGGLDSSSIFCLAETIRQKSPRAYPEILGFSYIFDDGLPSDEKSFLLDIEKDYSVSIRRIPIGSRAIMVGRKEEIWHVEMPFPDTMQNITDALSTNVKECGARLLLGGHWGDQVLFDGTYLMDLLHQGAWRKVWAHLREFGKWSLDVDPRYFKQNFVRTLIRSHIPPTLIPVLRTLKRKLLKDRSNHQYYSRGFQKLARLRTSNQTRINTRFAGVHAKSLYQQAKSRYNVLRMEWLNKVASIYGFEWAFPFLDKDLVSYLIGIPGEVQTWKGIPKGILREAMRGVLPPQIAGRRGKADFTDLVNDEIDQNYRELAHCLQSGGMAVRRGYVDEKIMSRELVQLGDHIRRQDCLVSWSLYDLLGLEIWLQVFFGETIEERSKTWYDKAG